MYVYENELDVLKFWKNALLTYILCLDSIYFAMLFNFYRIGSIDTSIGKWRYIFSILGIDGYIANWGVQTFFLVGEWFWGI